MKKARPSIRKWHKQIEGHQLLEYEYAWSAIHPNEADWGGGIYLQVGGWPVTWPEEDAVSQLRRKLVLRTYYNSEPWIEVFKRGQRYECIERIT